MPGLSLRLHALACLISVRAGLAVLAIAITLGHGTHAAAQAPRKELPNIVVMLADDLGPGDLGCYGGTIARTPNIDRLAGTGIRFTHYYAAAPICSPSRCGLLTGCYPGRWKITSFLQDRAGNRGCEQADFLDPAAPSLPRLLRTVGYRTAHFGKWHLGGGRDVKDAPPFARYGYDEHAGTWESPEPHPAITASNWIWSDKDDVKRWQRTAFFVDQTLDFLRRHEGSPCFVNLWLDDPHTPWVPSAKSGKGESRANLKAVLEEMDRQVGRLLACLKMQGQDKNTLVIFLSDNGPLPTFERARTAGLRGSKLSLYEGGVRVPFIVSWPAQVPAGRTDAATLVSGIDLLPTLAALTGATLPSGVHIDGADRSRALLGSPLPQRPQPLFWEYGRNDRFFKYPPAADRSPNLAVRDANWKLLVQADGKGAELYDLSADDREALNQIDRHPEVARRLTDAVLSWRRSFP